MKKIARASSHKSIHNLLKHQGDRFKKRKGAGGEMGICKSIFASPQQPESKREVRTAVDAQNVVQPSKVEVKLVEPVDMNCRRLNLGGTC